MHSVRITNSISIRVLIFTSLLLIGAWRAMLGSIGTVNWDYPIFLDGTWRVIQGQIPHVDFSTPIGPITYLIGYLGYLFTDLGMHSFDYGTVVVYFATTYFTFLWSKKHMVELPSILLTLLVGSYLITPKVIGYPFFNLGYTSYYNLIGYAFLYILAINVVFGRNNIWSGGWSGFLVVLCFFTKITFGFSALALAITKLLLERSNRDWWVGYILGFGLCSLCFLYYFNFNAGLVLDDYSIVFLSGGGEHNIVIRLFGLLQASILSQLTDPHSFLLAFVPFISCCLFLYLIYRDTVKRNGNRDFLTYLTLLMLLGVALMITIHQPPEFVAGPLVATLFLNWLSVKERFLKKRTLFLAKKLALLVIAIALLNNSLSLLAGTYKKYLMDQSKYAVAFNNVATLKGGFFDKNDQFSLELIDGHMMLQPCVKKSDQILVLGVNIFSFAFSTNSPKHSLLFWHDGFTFSDKTLTNLKKMEGANIFKDASIVMVPLTMVNKPENAIKHYQNYIEENFSLFSESQYWKMYIKKQGTDK